MKKILFSIILIGYSLCCLAQSPLHYIIDLNDRSNDEFKVTLEIDHLTEENSIYQFASTAPGTYQTMNIGRFVRSFKAFDKKGKEVKVEKLGINQWQLSKPQKVRTIKFNVAEIWDTPVEENTIYKMCGSSLEDDHTLFNAHCVIGYPIGMQSDSISLTFKFPEAWKVGTALSKKNENTFLASSFDHAVDSPILFGRLTTASADFNGTNIELYTYSVTDKINAKDLLVSMTDMLTAAHKFLVKFPVDRYTFLFHFEDKSAGAWEHSYSSEYVYDEKKYMKNAGEKITSTAAHEFFHIITPLNIHSEIIEQFNFVTPTPSEHLWLYEGTTEWASDYMQLRGGLMDTTELFLELQKKLIYSDLFPADYSLSELALKSFTKKGNRQYSNIYCKGAIVAGLLDIQLLDLSDGKKGLRELINELSQKYGPNKAFPENNIFNIISEMTYPEIKLFFDRYVKKAEPLPLKEFYNKIGVDYYDMKKVNGDSKNHHFEMNSAPNERQILLRKAWSTNL